MCEPEVTTTIAGMQGSPVLNNDTVTPFQLVCYVLGTAQVAFSLFYFTSRTVTAASWKQAPQQRRQQR